MKFQRLIALLLALCMCAALLAGCGSSSNSTSAKPYYAESAAGAYEEAADYSAEAALTGDSAKENTAASLPANRKFIITVNMQAETDDLDVLMESLNAKIAALAGYIESQDIQNGSTHSNRRYRNANMTVRIPVQQLDSFTEAVGSASNIVSSSRSTEDVTLSYVDTESRITALKTEQTRLLELMEHAETMADLLEVEARLTEVRSSLEMYSSRLRVMDNQIDYATIHLRIEEVKEYTPVAEKTRWQKICDGFVDSLSDLCDSILDFFAAILIDLPYLIFFAALVAVIVVICKFISKKHQAAKAKKIAARYQAMQAAQNQKKQEEQ